MNRLKAYVKRTILASATEGAWPAKRRTKESTLAAFRDASRGTDTGWWNDLIWTAGMLEMARKYAADIVTALDEYRDACGMPYAYIARHATDEDFSAADIALGVATNRLRRHAFTLSDYHGDKGEGLANAAEACLIGLRFAVEWYAGEVASEMGVEL
jgi:hypothetical protein